MSLDDYLQDSQELIETAIEQKDVGLVSMAIETTITTANRVVSVTQSTRHVRKQLRAI
jgi:hypothetical protein